MDLFTCRKKRLAWYLAAKGWTIYQAIKSYISSRLAEHGYESGYAANR